MKTHARFLPALVGGLFLIQCAGFFRGAGEVLVSDEEEARLGAQFHHTLLHNDTARRELPVFVPANQAQAEFQEYVLALCRETLAAIPANRRPAYDFTFTLIDKDAQNAFAVPGGYVYLFTGIIRNMRDESELAGVIGHEIAHVTRHHFRESLAKNAALSLTLQVLLGATGGGQGAQMAAGTFFQLASLRFSRSAEHEADQVGTDLLGRIRRNPLGIAKYFSRVEGGGIEWLSTHPGPRNRVREIRERVEADPALTRLAADSAATNYRERFQDYRERLNSPAARAILQRSP